MYRKPEHRINLDITELEYCRKVDEFISRVQKQDSGANIHVRRENCIYPQEGIQVADDTITIEDSSGRVSKYATYLREDGTVGGAVYV